MKKLTISALTLLIVAGNVLAVSGKRTQETLPISVSSGEFIRTWLICGLFPGMPSSQHQARRSFYIDYLTGHGGEGELTVKPGQIEEYESWKTKWEIYTSPTDIVDLRVAVSTFTDVLAYAYTEIERKKPCKAVLVIGSDYRARAWFNGKQVFNKVNRRALLHPEDTISVNFKKGVNKLLLKISQRKGDGGFYCRILPLGSGPFYKMLIKDLFPLVAVVLSIFVVGYLLDRKSKITEPSHSGRLKSLDALRGFDMFWLINGRNVFLFFAILTKNSVILSQAKHCAWNGFRFWDLIFPLFLFIVGCAMPYSLSKRIEQGTSKTKLYIHIIQRTLILFVLGLIYSGGVDVGPLSNIRILGVLQRIAICYFFASVIMLNFRIRGQVITFFSILVGYWFIMTFVPVPDIGAGVLLQGKNLANYIDSKFLPGSLCRGTWDNEGLLSTLPAIASTLLGIFAGHWLRSIRTQNKKTVGLLVGGLCCLVLGKIWNIWFPINKLIWTSSYVLYAGGWSLLLLSLFYWLIDVKGYRKWAFPFIVIGMNAIAIYAFGKFINFESLSNHLIGGEIGNLFGPGKKLWTLTGEVILAWLLLYWLYCKKIFIKF